MADFNFGNLFPGYRDMSQQVAETDRIKAQTVELLEASKGQKLQNQQTQMQMDFQRKLQMLMQGQVTGVDQSKPRDVAAEMDETASLYKAAGFVNDAAALNEKASLIRSHNAAAARAKIAQEKEQLEMVEKHTKDAAQIADTITDADSWEQATKGTEFEGTPYSPQMVQALKAAGETVHEQITDKRQAGARADAHLKMLSDQELAKAREERLRVLNEKTRADMASKAGKEKAKSAAAPNKAELGAAAAALRTAYPGLDVGAEEGKTSPAMAAAAESVASEAKQIIAANPAIKKFDQAVHQAMANQAHNFKQLGKKTKFVGGGDTPEEALPLPTKEEDLVDGKYYDVGGTPHQAVGGKLFAAGLDEGEEIDNPSEEEDAAEQ